MHHRNGNVHDFNGAQDFINACVENVQTACPQAKIELRLDGAFFREQIIESLDNLGVQYSISCPL